MSGPDDSYLPPDGRWVQGGTMVEQLRIRFPTDEELARYHGDGTEWKSFVGLGHLVTALNLVDSAQLFDWARTLDIPEGETSLLAGTAALLLRWDKSGDGELVPPPHLAAQLLEWTEEGVHAWFRPDELDLFVMWLGDLWEACEARTEEMKLSRGSAEGDIERREEALRLSKTTFGYFLLELNRAFDGKVPGEQWRLWDMLGESYDVVH